MLATNLELSNVIMSTKQVIILHVIVLIIFSTFGGIYPNQLDIVNNF